MKNEMIIKGARENNLKNIDLTLPLNKIICFAGPSGSGKTSLAFHTILAESKRRFLNSYSNSLKFFSQKPTAVMVDSIEPVLPVFGLPQINPVVGSRTNVSDSLGITEILQNIFFHASKEYCLTHNEPMIELGVVSQIDLAIKKQDDEDIIYLFVAREQFLMRFSSGVLPARSWSEELGEMRDFDSLDSYWEISRFRKKNSSSSKEHLYDNQHNLIFHEIFWISSSLPKLQRIKLSSSLQCPTCHEEESHARTINLFSPLNAQGACSTCNGFGAKLEYDREKIIDKNLSISDGAIKILMSKNFLTENKHFLKECKNRKYDTEIPLKKMPKDFFSFLDNGAGSFCGVSELLKYLDRKRYKPSVRIFIRSIQKEIDCPSCHGSRFNYKVKSFFMKSNRGLHHLPEVLLMNVEQIAKYFENIKLEEKSVHLVKIVRKINNIFDVAQSIGLGHLSLMRKTKTLSAGEYQRLLLLKYLSFEGTDSLFIFDEPTLGLGIKQIEKLYEGLLKIRDQGNTIVVIDHSDFFQQNSDYLVKLGPGSGKDGGEILYSGIADKKQIQRIDFKRKVKLHSRIDEPLFEFDQVEIYGKIFKNIKVQRSAINWVYGDSGTGKTSLFIKAIANEINNKLYNESLFDKIAQIGKYHLSQKLNDLIIVDANLNRYTSRSSVGSITDLAKPVRKHFMNLPVSRAMNLQEGHFSSNSELGQCLTCQGRGDLIVEMQYLEDIILECEDCNGTGLKAEYASISDGSFTAAEAFDWPLSVVLEKVSLTAKYKRIKDYLDLLNLNYLSLNRSVSSLSGGEKQRIYLLSKLISNVDNSLIIFENLSFGLSQVELIKLCTFLEKLVEKENTLIVIDQNPIFGLFASYHLELSQDGISLKS